MGDNAVTSVPKYQAADVLTAANLNITNSGIPVFSGTATRNDAFGGSGEKVLAEGQFAYLEDSNTTQFYDGAAWQPVGTTAGLVYITGASFTTATTVSFPNDTFSSTYRNYKFFFQLTALTTDSDITLRFRTAGSDNTTSVYGSAFIGNSTALGQVDIVGNNLTSIKLADSDSGNGDEYYLVFDVIAPKATAVTSILGGGGFINKADQFRAFYTGGGNFDATTSFDSLSIISSVASSMTGVYRVYGYSES
jgi:hypothetical protein